ncbi:MAG: porin [Phyllobacterium sp.]
MNIKSLLLGSAAALVAVSGARAADAVVIAEPEPVEYVRVCDAYGAGYFYIPGTETCLAIGGMIRYDIGANSEADGWMKNLRTELKVTAKSETELGTLGAYIRLRSDTQSGFKLPYVDGNEGRFGNDSGMFVQDAIISLGGLELGLSDTLFDDELPNFENEFTGADRIHFMRYTFTGGNGFSATLALEEADYDYDYVPNIVGKVGVAQGWGSANFYAAYDASREEFALKGVATVAVTNAVELGLIATYESDYSFYSLDNGLDDFGGYEWSAGASAKFKATDKLAFTVGGQYFGANHFNDGDDYTVGVVVDYNIVENFDTKLAVNYYDGDNYEDGEVGGFLRFERNF